MSKELFLSNSRDIPILLFIWRWKVCSSAAIGHRFFSGYAPKTIYNRLRILNQAGYIETASDHHEVRDLWTLTKKGFQIISSLLPPLREEGFKSEHIYHDFIVSSVHLGEWLCETPPGVELFSEQQLRRYDFEFFPSWVPQLTLHRPDGYWHFRSEKGETTIALEIELTAKRSSDYQEVANFYRHSEDLNRVIWVVPTESALLRIQKEFRSENLPKGSMHNFMLLQPYLKMGWQTSLASGPDAGNTLAMLLNRFLSGNHSESSGKSSGTLPHFSLLNTKKVSF